MSAAVRQSSAQAYLQQNRIGALFEELMASLIRDQPQEPLIHLMRSLQRKASERGLAVPVTLRPPEDLSATGPAAPRPSTAAPAVGVKSATASAAVGGSGGGRSYDKPWLRGSAAGAVGGPVRKSTSGEPLAGVDKSLLGESAAFEESPLARGSSQQHRQPSRASLASTGAEAVFLWSSTSPVVGLPTAPQPTPTAASIAEAEADILGGEFRLARAAATAETAANTTVVAAAAGGGGGGGGVPRKQTTAGARLAAKEARRRQLEAALARTADKRRPTPSGVNGVTEEDEADADGVLLLEDADALAAEGARISTQRRSGGHAAARGVATSRQRDAATASAAAAAAAAGAAGGPVTAEPQVRMTFCGRCFALISEGEEDGVIAGLAPFPQTASAGDAGGGGGGVDLGLDEFDQFAPQTGRTNATMTEVTDIESASQVTGPRRPSWTATKQQQQKMKASGGKSTRGEESEVSASASRGVAGSGGGVGRSKGWGAAAAAAGEDSDPETTTTAPGDRLMQQDNRLY